jgi:hypothetical protein
MTGAAFSVLIGHVHDENDIPLLASAAASAAYLAMTPGGQVIRVVGEMVWSGSNTIAKACQTLWMAYCNNTNDNHKNLDKAIASNVMVTTTATAAAASSPPLTRSAWDNMSMMMTNAGVSFLSKTRKDTTTKD